MTQWADDDPATGQHAYVVEVFEFGASYFFIAYAEDLAEAKRVYGYRRMQHESRKVRRATRQDAIDHPVRTEQ